MNNLLTHLKMLRQFWQLLLKQLLQHTLCVCVQEERGKRDCMLRPADRRGKPLMHLIGLGTQQ